MVLSTAVPGGSGSVSRRCYRRQNNEIEPLEHVVTNCLGRCLGEEGFKVPRAVVNMGLSLLLMPSTKMSVYEASWYFLESW
jgi:hypothetical protein